MYHFYLKGCSKPVWSYKTWHWARKRLNRLMEGQSLKSCRVEYNASYLLGRVTEVGYVSFSEFGWFIEWKCVK